MSRAAIGFRGMNDDERSAMTPIHVPPDQTQLDAVRAALRKFHEPRFDDEPITQWLKSLVRQFGDPSAALATLAAYDTDPRIQEDAILMIFTAADEPEVPPKVKKSFSSVVPPTLMAALRDTSVPDERKAILAPLLVAYGAEIPPEELTLFFRDFEGAAQHMLRQTAEKIPDTIESVADELEMAGLISSMGNAPDGLQDLDEYLAMSADICEHNRPVGTGIICISAVKAYERGVSVEKLEGMLERAAELGGERAAWFLGELGRLPAMGALGESARALALELTHTGVRERAPLTGEFSHGMISSIDGTGSRSVNLFFRTSEGEMDAVTFIFNDEAGVLDAWCIFSEAAGLDDAVREQNRDNGLTFAACNLELARRIAGDALATHERVGRPVPGEFLLYRHLLGTAPLVSAKHEPNLGVYMLETVTPRPEIVERSEQLLDAQPFGSLWCCSDDAYQYVLAHMPRKKKRQAAKALAFLRRGWRGIRHENRLQGPRQISAAHRRKPGGGSACGQGQGSHQSFGRANLAGTDQRYSSF